MYTCQLCGGHIPSRVEQVKLVMEVREKTYPNGSKGQEIVKEISVCPPCFETNQRKIDLTPTTPTTQDLKALTDRHPPRSRSLSPRGSLQGRR